jgi:hypothetical protein
VITAKRLKRIEALLRDAGFGPSIDWSETVPAPATAEEFASQAIYVICNSGMRNTVAASIYDRCMAALNDEVSVRSVFRHPGKSTAIDIIWNNRSRLFEELQQTADPLAYLRTLPWIGPITSLHLWKNLGGDVAKPDVHLERLARRDRTTPEKMCRRLAIQAGCRVATVDTILWRACAEGLLSSPRYEQAGWRAAFQPAAFKAMRD